MNSQFQHYNYEEKKAMAQEIGKMSILYPNSTKEFYHHIKLRKSLMNRKCSIRNFVLKNFPIFTGKHLCWSYNAIFKERVLFK